MVNLASLTQEYGAGASFSRIGSDNPAVTKAALSIIDGSARVPERLADIRPQQVVDARTQDQGHGRG
jgi:hypothetical protein